MITDISFKTNNKKSVKWYALSTRFRFEKKVNEELSRKGYESYLPMYLKVSNWSDRKKKIKVPLFPRYVFIKLDLKFKINVLQTSGVINFVSFENIPVAIPDQQIMVVKDLINGKRRIKTVHKFTKGQKVKVTHGVLRGYEGFYTYAKDKYKLIIHLDSINQSFEVEINADEIIPC